MFSDTKRGESSENRSIERYLILGIVALIPISTLSIRGHTDLDAGIILSIFILPITLRTTIKSRMPRRLLVLLLLALVCGPVLTLLATSTPARSVDQAIEIETLFLVLSFCISIPTVYWSVVKSGWAPTLNAFAVGAIAQGALNHSAWNGNAWKYVFAWPVVALILPKQGWGSRSRAYGIVVVVALILISIVFNNRSFAAFLCGAIVIGVLASRIRHPSARVRSVVSVVVVCLVGVGLYFGGSLAVTHGLLGRSIQLTSQAETANGQNLVIGARPEFAAALALFASHPLGFGPGVVPSEADVNAGKAGLASVGAATTGGFVDGFLFGQHLELHSVWWDLWIDFGPVGLAAGAYVGWLSIKLLLLVASSTRAPPFVLLTLGLGAFWDVLFSPIGNLMLDIVAILAMLGFVLSAQGMDDFQMQREDMPKSLDRV